MKLLFWRPGFSRWVWRSVLWLAILAACLVVQTLLVEAGLRWVGVGETTRFLLGKEASGQRYYAPNRAFYQQFTALPLDRIMTWDDLDFQVPETKAPHAFRIFVFGSSAIYGPRTSSRMLTMMLRDRAPDIQWEVYNTACPGMNSHVMRAAARACRDLQPDLYLIYMGNNEAVGPFGPTTALGRHPWLWRPSVIRLLIAMNDLRVVQWFRGGNRSVSAPEKDALMQMLPSMTDHARAVRYYEDNVRDMIASAEQKDIPTVLCTLAGNMRYMGQTTPEEPAGPSINGVLRALAEELPSAHLADVNRVVREHSVDGLPGYDYFVDNVHFNFEGNHLAATAMFDAMRPLLPPLMQGDVPPLSRDACAERLAWTPAAEYEQLGWQLQVFLDDYTGALVRARRAALEQQLGEGWRHQLAADHLHALSLSESDLLLRHAAFRWLMDTGQYDAAGMQAQELLARHPAARAALRAQGIVAEARGQGAAAETAYRACLQFYPDDPESLRRLAELLFNRNELAEARACYDRYLNYAPDDAFARCRVGQLLAKSGRQAEAMALYREIIRETPRQPLAYRLLDEVLEEEQTAEERARFWDDMIVQYPEAAEPRARRAALHLQAGDAAAALTLLREAVERDPHDPALRSALEALP